MHEEIKNLIDRLDNPLLLQSDVIQWASPVPSFGNLDIARIATLGLNPSNREFEDLNGLEITGFKRRFHTLSSLGLNKWSDANDYHLNLISDSCQDYFSRNPYSAWFKRLDYLLSGTSCSYYFPSGLACHLDIIPYATASKWSELSFDTRSLLLKVTGDTLGMLLKNSQIELLILNGQTVVDNLQKVSNIKLEKTAIENWNLPRVSGGDVKGYAYMGKINSIGAMKLNRNIKVLGYNHNIQSSFGVTKEVLLNIRNWISNNYKAT